MERNREEGWQYAKLSGHKNEDLITQLVQSDESIQSKLVEFAKKTGRIIGVAEGGLCETSIPSVLGDSTKSKPDLKLKLDNGQKINISIKKSWGGQVFLITPDRFIRGFEKQYGKVIPQDVKRAIGLFWGSEDDTLEIIRDYAQIEKDYQTRKHRLVKDTMDKYNPQLSHILITWFKENIIEIFDFCFVRGLALNQEDWADILWYKNLLEADDDDIDELFSIEELKQKIGKRTDLIVYGTRTGGSTIQLPFGFVQWHQNSLQFHHKLCNLLSL